MEFNINKYDNGKYVMHVKTKEEYDDFLKHLRDIGSCRYGSANVFGVYKQDTCLNFDCGTHCDIKWYKDHNFTILEWEDFMSKTFTMKNLKSGDIVKDRCGDIGIVNAEVGAILHVNHDDIAYFTSYHDNLTNRFNSSYDIVAVRRPATRDDFSLNAFKYELGKLVYERKEVEEMTLEQVCKALGKNIKIVKG